MSEVQGHEIGPDFERFDQMNDMFTRAFWDPGVRSKDTDAFFASYRSGFSARRGDGFTQKDFALRNASWLVSDLISNRSAEEGLREGFQGAIRRDTPMAEEQVKPLVPKAQAAEVKKVARLFGADLVAITARDERWHYVRRPDTRDMTPVEDGIPAELTHVIVMGHEMDAGLTDAYPSALAGAATGREYSHEAAIAMQLAAYLRGIGWDAVASMNDSALVVPYAIQAGLGEYGRNQMVLTPEYGPRLRFSKVFTALPMAHDRPRSMGLTSYCEGCTLCAEACPPKALPKGEPTFGTFDGTDSPSTIKGVRKWSANCEKCFGYWAKLRSDCAICMRVCPFSMPGWPGRVWKRLALSSLRPLARWWAERYKRPRLKPSEWWSA